jgi:DNA invertase Pin-like site-specific DNA recombinase
LAVQRKACSPAIFLLPKQPFVKHNQRMKPICRVCLYARVSTRDRGQDNENQLAQLREFCKRQGWHVVNVYTDRATGKNSDRKEFRAMLDAAGHREFDAVVTWALDRLSREGVAQTFEHIKTLLSYGVQYISYSEPHFRTTGPAGELMVAIAAWIAQQERIRLSERTLAGLARARKQGRVGGRPRLIVNRAKVAEMDADGMTMREIAEELRISPASVCRLLKARAAGLALYPSA